MNSAELLTRYGAGSEEAFGELVRRHADLVFSVAKRRLGSAALAEEAAQIVFMRLASSKPRLSSEGDLLGWLHRTALHVSIDLVRSETRRRIREEKNMHDVVTEEEPLWQEIAPILDKALDRLKDEERAILLLRFFERKAFAEVGAAFRISEDAAKMRVARALEKLRELLGTQKARCTAAVFSALLLQRAVEAAPVTLADQIVLHRPLVTSVLPGWLLPQKGVLIGGGAFLLVGTLLLYSILRGEKPVDVAAEANFAAPIAGSERAFASKRQVPSTEELDSVAAPRRKFDPVSTRTILTLLDSESGAPIAGGRVHMAYFYAGGVGEGHKRVSDSDGEIAIPFPNQEGDKVANIFVTAEGYVPRVWTCRGTFPESYEMKLDPALTLAGHVVDEQGEPVPNVKVTMDCYAFEMDERKAEHVALNSPETTSVTDEFGAFSYPYVPREIPPREWGPAEVKLNLTAEGFEVTQIPLQVPVAARNDLKLVIQKGVVVSGRVVDLDGRGVENVLVRELHNSGERILRTKTNANGDFWLHGVWYRPSEKQVRIVVEPNDWACQEKTITVERTNVVDFVLAKSIGFRAAVRDEEGMPMADVTVRIDDDKGGISKYEWLDKTNIDGRVEWTSAPAEPTLFWFEKEGYQTIRDMELTPDGTEFQIVLKRGGSRPK